MVLHQTSGAYVGRGYESGISHHDPGALQIIVCYCKSQGREEDLHLRQKKQQQHKIKKTNLNLKSKRDQEGKKPWAEASQKWTGSAATLLPGCYKGQNYDSGKTAILTKL